jgi:circadian clock protein KaiB
MTPEHGPQFQGAPETLGGGALTGDGERYDLRLYVAGSSLRSQTAIENVRRVCAEHLRGRCRLEVIDIYQEPDRFREDQILAVPTLIRRAPLPSRRTIGDLSEWSKVLAGLGLAPRA